VGNYLGTYGISFPVYALILTYFAQSESKSTGSSPHAKFDRWQEAGFILILFFITDHGLLIFGFSSLDSLG